MNPEHEEAKRKWQEMKDTKYTDEDILKVINLAGNPNLLSEISLEKSALAQAMIAYNNMIDARINRAEKSWVA